MYFQVVSGACDAHIRKYVSVPRLPFQFVDLMKTCCISLRYINPWELDVETVRDVACVLVCSTSGDTHVKTLSLH